MGYEINVSKDGKHFFATAERSIGLDNLKLQTLFFLFQKQFPESEGYKISATKWETKGEDVDVSKYNYSSPNKN